MFKPTLSSSELSTYLPIHSRLATSRKDIMFFSAKVLYPVFAVFSIAATAFASPAVAPVSAADLAKRQSTDVVNELQGFQSTVTPLIDQLSMWTTYSIFDGLFP